MLTAALDGLVDRFGLEGERLGEVAAGAVLKHSRDFNLTRECVLGSRLAPETPGLRRPAGVRHRPGGGDPRRQQDRARPDRRRASPAASTRPPTRRSRSTRTCARCCSRPTARSRTAGRVRALAGVRPQPDRARDPAQRGAAHRPVDGRAPGAHRRRVGRHARGAGRARRCAATSNLAAAYERGFNDDLVTPVPRARARPEPAPGHHRRRSSRSSSRSSAARTAR